MKKKLMVFSLVITMTLCLLLLFRKPLLYSAAKFLIVETHRDSHLQYGFVLSGGAFDRGHKAANLYHSGSVKQFVCTGANQSPDLKAFGTDMSESDLTKLQMTKLDVPDSVIVVLKKGSSTLSEALLILAYCKKNQLNKIAVISSKFHTRRIHQVFTDMFLKEGIEVYIYGAPSSMYNEMKWWESEYGLIALNNEYLKQLYYLFK